MPSWVLSKYIETKLQNTMKLSCRSLVFISYNAFLNNKNKPVTSLPASFSYDFWRKLFALLYFYWLTKFHCLVASTLWEIGQYIYYNCLITRLWRHKFWNWSYLFYQTVFSTSTKSLTFKNLENEKSF